MAILTSLFSRGDVLKYELNQNTTRQVVTVKQQSALLPVGTVLGAVQGDITAANTVVTAGAGNTGDGTLTKDATTPVLAGAMVGVYRIELQVAGAATTPAVPATWTVYAPDGAAIGEVATGGTFDNFIKFAIAAGGTPFAVNDYFTFEVIAGTGKAVPVAQADQADGSHNVLGVLLENVDASAADTKSVALVRGPAIVARHGLVWGAAFDTEAKKLPKILQLQARGIIIGEDK